jgi:hypothetical protein
MTVPTAPGPLAALRTGATAAVLGGVTYVATLAAFSVVQGHTVLYPFRAVAAIFRGNHVLPGYGRDFDTGSVAAVYGGTLWILVLSMACAGIFVFLVRSRGLAPAWVVPLAVGWALLWLLLALLVFDHGGSPGVRRRVSSFQGLHELGIPAFVVAHAAFGAVVGLWWSRRLGSAREPVPAAAG